MIDGDRRLQEKLSALQQERAAWERTADVIVIGAGLAGMCAALEAADCGASVLLLEKQPQIGGSTVLSGGAMAFARTAEQLEAGIEDSEERLYDDLRRVGAFENDEALVRTYVERQFATYGWLKERGVVFDSVELGGGQSVPRSNRIRPRQAMAALAERAAESARIETAVGVPARRLVRADDVVAGVLVESGGAFVGWRARRGVVLASGGFSRSEEELRIFAPGLVHALRIGGAGCTGDGLRMAWALGAGMRDMGFIKGTFGSHPQAGAEQNAVMHPIYRGGIAVNTSGRRFIDESLSYKLIGDACLQQPGRVAFQIFDQAIMNQSVAGVVSSDFRAALEAGWVKEAPALEQLAQKIGVDATTLCNTVQEYNRDVDTGHDSLFERDGLGNHYGRLVKIDAAPFYAYASTSAVVATYCGVTVDSAMHVLDVFGSPIRGLFAAGEIIGGFHGAAYMTGSSLGKSAVFGRIAGHTAATAE